MMRQSGAWSRLEGRARDGDRESRHCSRRRCDAISTPLHLVARPAVETSGRGETVAFTHHGHCFSLIMRAAAASHRHSQTRSRRRLHGGGASAARVCYHPHGHGHGHAKQHPPGAIVRHRFVCKPWLASSHWLRHGSRRVVALLITLALDHVCVSRSAGGRRTDNGRRRPSPRRTAPGPDERALGLTKEEKTRTIRSQLHLN